MKLSPRKVIHRKVADHRFILFFRENKLGIVNRKKVGAEIVYELIPLPEWEDVIVVDSRMRCKMADLKADVLELMPKDLPLAPGMPVVDD